MARKSFAPITPVAPIEIIPPQDDEISRTAPGSGVTPQSQAQTGISQLFMKSDGSMNWGNMAIMALGAVAAGAAGGDVLGGYMSGVGQGISDVAAQDLQRQREEAKAAAEEKREARAEARFAEEMALRKEEHTARVADIEKQRALQKEQFEESKKQFATESQLRERQLAANIKEAEGRLGLGYAQIGAQIKAAQIAAASRENIAELKGTPEQRSQRQQSERLDEALAAVAGSGMSSIGKVKELEAIGGKITPKSVGTEAYNRWYDARVLNALEGSNAARARGEGGRGHSVDNPFIITGGGLPRKFVEHGKIYREGDKLWVGEQGGQLLRVYDRHKPTGR